MKKEMKEVEQLGKKSSNSSLIITIIVILVFLIAGYLFYLYFIASQAEEETVGQEVEPTALTLSDDIESSRMNKIANTDGVYWVRECDFIWDEIEPSQGQFDFSIMDEKIKDVLIGRQAYPIVIIRPFASWDQNTCHTSDDYLAPQDGKHVGDLKLGKPCNMDRYKNFLAKSVERYDGDGVDDMPGLTEPIKYWEVINEPIMQGGGEGGAGEELKFFVGSSQDYLDTLKATYIAIKQADPQAQVLNGGMAGMQQEVKDFWGPILAKGGGDYFDIANNHTISTTSDRADLYMIEFNNFLKKYGLEDKPVWITEVQYGSLMDEPSKEERTKIEQLMVKSTAMSFAMGADKLVYIQNWLFWGTDMLNQPKKEGEKKPEGTKENKREEYSQENLNSTTHKVYLTLVDKLNHFDQVKTIKQKYQITGEAEMGRGAKSTLGQYKFTNGDQITYVLWGKGQLPAEITGLVKVSDIYGNEQTKSAKNIVLTDEPIFVEPIE